MSFDRTEKQAEAIEMLSTDATNCAMFGGSGSGKTFIALYALCGKRSPWICSRACLMLAFLACFKRTT